MRFYIDLMTTAIIIHFMIMVLSVIAGMGIWIKMGIKKWTRKTNNKEGVG